MCALRYLVNRLLNTFESVIYLDCDLGQSEFCPPGMVSLNVVQTPIIGPQFTHIQQPLLSYFVGDSNPGLRPGYYLDCFCKLVDYFRKHFCNGPVPTVPLVINTCGWVKGMGLDLLIELLKYSSPNNILQTAAPQRKLNFLFQSEAFPNLKPKPRMLYHTICNEGPYAHWRLEPRDQREMMQRAYFADYVTPIYKQVPYCVPWNRMRISFNSDVSPSETLFALNGVIVGLCIDDTSYEPVSKSTGDHQSSLYPQFIVDYEPMCNCVGQGLIRTIDPQARVFYILTTTPIEKLKKVNTLIRGSLEIPICIALTYLSSNIMSLPYITKETSIHTLATKERSTSSQLRRGLHELTEDGPKRRKIEP